MDEEQDSDSEVEEYSGMEQPPLIKQLKTILAEYPDDGQIIKELVQNAEDAGASEMKILYDGRILNTTLAKKLPYRKFFKAPALCFYNNEVFSENDWRGIKMIYSSVKEEDPLKVGRFGLGFKSVFHITDFPCIISGSKILLINPHEKVPDKVCITIELKKLRKCKRLKVEEFLEALTDTFGFSENNLNTGNYEGTIFWFPLREIPPETNVDQKNVLSTTCYDRSMVLDLFRSFQTEATNSLLFLKSLCKIDLYCRRSETEYDLPDGQPFFSVEMEDVDKNIQVERKQFLQEVKITCGSIPENDIVCCACPTFKACYRTRDCLEVDEKKISSLVINVYKGDDMSEKLRNLVSDKDLSYMPYVGASVPLTDNKGPVKGHIFCFLPLPQEKKSLTGLPVHFNGFFALSQNRRHLKWASADQETLHMHRDKAIEWNECLVNEVLPEVYLRLMKEIIKISIKVGNTEHSVKAVYRCIPDISVVDSKWEGCLEAFYGLLLTADLIFISKKSKWIKPFEALYTMFDTQTVSYDQQESVRKLLNLHKDVDNTTVPNHVWELLKKVASLKKTTPPNDISPSELCNIIKSEDIYRNAIDEMEKLHLLEYIIKDKNFGLLLGLELLPLENGSFVTFQDLGTRPTPLYFCSKEEIALFPGLEDRFVASKISKTLEGLLQQTICSGQYQLRRLAVSGMVSLLEETIEHNFGNIEPVILNMTNDSSFGKWIEKLWVYLFEKYSEVLSDFANLPLLPCLISGSWGDESWKTGEVHLHRMNRTFVLKSGKDIDELSNDVCDAFKHLSIEVLPSLPKWLDVSKLSCISSATGPSLARLLEQQYSRTPNCVGSFNSNCSLSEAKALVTLLDRISSPFTTSLTTFLKQLNLFSCKSAPFDMNTVLSCVSKINQIVRSDVSLYVPVRFPEPILVSSTQNCLSLAKKLGVIEVDEDQLVCDILRRMSIGSYSNNEIQTFMLWFLTQLNRFQTNNTIMSLAKNFAFVWNGENKYKPSDLYDPKDSTLMALFHGERKFPVNEFASEPNIIALKRLGLKTKKEVSANCLYTAAKDLDAMCTSKIFSASMERKARALMHILEKRSDILHLHVEMTGHQLHTSIRAFMCLPHQKERPDGYPKDLAWKGTEFALCSPTQLKSASFSSVAGSVLPLVKFDSEEFGQFFQWNSFPGPEALIKQLENLKAAYSSTNKACLLSLISAVYRAMADRESEVIRCGHFQRLLQSNCIWWGDGFCKPDQIVLVQSREDIDLRPYVYPLPAELEFVKSFIGKLGCHQKQSVPVLLEVLDLVDKKHTVPQGTDENTVRKDLNLVLQILNKLFIEKVSSDQYGDKLLFPVHTGDDKTLILKPYTQCTYCDAQWLKEITEQDRHDNDEILYVHADVSLTTAEGLGVKSLKKQLMSDAEGFEEWGQEEPLTRRLNNILKEGYLDGLAVPKEIIQNADDAGATTVQFVYDERENMDARSQLLDDGMEGGQGPALWAYNNKQFSDIDLRNITKLSGATKENDTTKIGKFGLGFCAVYNLTDIPSFVSGHNMVIFDPHTTYLNKALPGNSPGLKINLRTLKNKRLMKRMKNQFKPFNGVLGCDLAQREPCFDGTLFRFPLRTPSQAAVSEIKNVSYSKREMVSLLKQFVVVSGSMLLFTQNLQEIKIFHIPAVGVGPDSATLLCSVTKEFKVNSLGNSVLDICSKLKINNSLHSNPFAAVQKLIITVKCEDHRGILGNIQAKTTQSQWLLSWATGTSRSLKLSCVSDIKGALPLGSVAVLIASDTECLIPQSLSECPFGFYKTSHVFCYLPLPVQTKLEFHVNGSFAVTSNRRGLQASTEDDKHGYDSKWNEALLSDAVAQAFINILVYLQDPMKLSFTSLSPEYHFFQLWPTKDSQLISISHGFYSKIIDLNSPVFETYGDGKWLGLKQCLFLDNRMSQDDEIRQIALPTLQKFNQKNNSTLGTDVVDIPPLYYREMQSTKVCSENMIVIGEEEFFLKFFLPNIGDTYWDESEEKARARINLILYCIDHSTSSIDEQLKSINCIPTQPNGMLRNPRDLVHPSSLISPLFFVSDERFPTKAFESTDTLKKLETIGMMTDTLEPEILIDRAKSISVLAFDDSELAFDRCKHFTGYLSNAYHKQEGVIPNLKDIVFLPVLEKPKNWPFRWKSAVAQQQSPKVQKVVFESPEKLFFAKCKKLVACEEHILDTNRLTTSETHRNMFELLGVKTITHVGTDTVISQLITVCTQSVDKTDGQSNLTTDEILDEIYMFLNKAVVEQPEETTKKLQALKNLPVIRIGSVFLPASKVAFSVGYDCSPELYEIGYNRIRRHRSFLTAIGVKEHFDVGDLIEVLKRNRLYYKETVLPKNVFHLVTQLLLCLTGLMKSSDMTYDDIAKKFGKDSIVAPDESQILRPTHRLCFDDCDFIEATTLMKFIHKDLSRTEAEKLGVLTKRTKHIEDCSIEIPFEQKEELVTRLKRLLEGYPCDVAILKELIQNADDAGATEIHFLKDLRTHACNKIFADSFSEFQGPALCVFNDSCFTQADLLGIQQLGIGSKSEDPARTGKYGVGFNAVYNLTDLPSFLTKGPEIEGGETLCIFDPLHKHSQKRVGTRYIDMQEIRKTYPDIVSGYNESTFFTPEHQTGSIFRFPLRQSESAISKTVIKPEDLEKTLFVSSEYDVLEIMLFLKHVTKISISTISKEKHILEHSASLNFSDKDKLQRERFSSQCKKAALDVKNKHLNLFLIQPSQVNYNVKTKSAFHDKDTWFIGQSIGLKEDDFPQSVRDAVQDGKLGLLPVGGIAVRLPKNECKPSRKSDSWELRTTRVREDSGRPYCFLPLPGLTGLPFHANGYFILDHEARRGLWKRESQEEFKAEWNHLILAKVIPRSYVEALQFIKDVLFKMGESVYTEHKLIEKLVTLEKYFPLVKETRDENWRAVATSVFKDIINTERKMFPIVKKQCDQDGFKYTVTWSSMRQNGHKFPVYTQHDDMVLSVKDPLQTLLRNFGMKITSVSKELQQSLTDSKFPIPPLDGTAVISFLKSYSGSEADRCLVDRIPCEIQETLYERVHNVNEALYFCSKSDSFVNELDGLPLLVTNDSQLRCFCVREPVFCTEYVTLMLKSAHRFVHEKQVLTVDRIGMENVNSVIKTFHVDDFAGFLSDEISNEIYNKNNLVAWDPSTFVFPNHLWIRRLWKFLESDFKISKSNEDKEAFEHFLKPLENWCLLPTAKNKSNKYLVKIRNAYSVLEIETFASVPSLENVLRKLELPCLLKEYFSEHAQKLISSNLVRADDPVSLLICLKYYKGNIKEKHLQCSECLAVLGYFSDNLTALREDKNAEDTWLKESLKCLPLFITKDGQSRSFEEQDCRVLVIRKGIPEDGLDQWAQATRTVLLRNEIKVQELYEFLGFTKTDNIDIYAEHILKRWDSLPDFATIAHLKYIKDKLISSYGLNEKQRQIVNIMHNTPLIAENGVRKRVSEYYSPHHPVLGNMCRADEFPPEIMCSQDWISFLEEIGLTNTVSGPLFLRFAKEVAAGGRMCITEELAKNSRVLVSHLFTHTENWARFTYQEISKIRFVVPHVVDACYTRVHKQYSDPCYFICFRNAISGSFSKLVWTSLPLLSEYADPGNYYKQGHKSQVLGLHEKPTLESVIKNTQNVCDSLKRHFETNAPSHVKELYWIELLMENLYDFLQLHGLQSRETKEKLQHTPVVFIPESNLLVRAKYVLQDISSDQEISPYILKAPFRFGKHFPLFQHLGAEKYPTYRHYIQVLKMVKDDVQDNRLTNEYLSEWGVIRVALENLFYLSQNLNLESCVISEREVSSVPTLYLPTREKFMKKATELTVADNRYFKERLGSSGCLQYLIDFKAVKLSYSMAAIKWLPSSIQPKFLSEIVKEKVDISQMLKVETCQTGLRLEQFIHCKHFIEGLLRLLKHYKSEVQLTVTKKEEETVSLRIQNTRVRQVSGLKTHLYLNEVKIEDSAETKNCFVPHPNKKDKDMQMWIYFQTEFESELEFVQSLDEHLIRYIHYILSFKIPEHLIMEVFNKISDPESIGMMLDKVPIDPYHMSDEVLFSVFPEPGTYVPVELHHLLNCDILEFKRHEYHSVALELEDTGILDNIEALDACDPVYIYVRIERKVPTEGEESIVSQKFEVFTGTEIVIVPAFKIYKFIRPKAATCTDVVDSSVIPPTGNSPSLHKVLYSIRHILQEAWELPEEDRRHIIKRLYLRWHPDKNIGNEDFCSEVFRYIKEVICKLEKGVPLDDDVPDGISRQSRAYPDFSSSPYFEFCERMNRRSRIHREQEQKFSTPGPSGFGGFNRYGSGFSHRDSRKKPYKDLAEAQRWQRQAKVDLRNARETIGAQGDPPTYNWICYMCHQASEKSLKAAAFARDANSIDKNSHDVVGLASEFPYVQFYARELANLVGVHTKMRYPDVLHRPHIPSTVYTRDQADRACELARQILDTVADNYLS